MEDQGRRTDRDDAGATPSRGDPDERARLRAAVLELVGERGWRGATPDEVCGRAGVDLARFHLHYADLAGCFLDAYGAAVGPRLTAMLELAAVAPDRAAAAKDALGYLFAFVTRRPAVARAVLVEVYVAGGAVSAEHQEVLERLSRAVTGVCRETHPSRHDPPPLTAGFIVGGIEEVVRRRLTERREAALWEDLPELTASLLSACGE